MLCGGGSYVAALSVERNERENRCCSVITQTLITQNIVDYIDFCAVNIHAYTFALCPYTHIRLENFCSMIICRPFAL